MLSANKGPAWWLTLWHWAQEREMRLWNYIFRTIWSGLGSRRYRVIMLLLWVISHQTEHLHTILSSGRGLTRLGRNILCDLIYIFFLNKTNYFKLTWDRSETERDEDSDKFVMDGKTGRQTDIVTPWAPDGAKKWAQEILSEPETLGLALLDDSWWHWPRAISWRYTEKPQSEFVTASSRWQVSPRGPGKEELWVNTCTAGQYSLEQPIFKVLEDKWMYICKFEIYIRHSSLWIFATPESPSVILTFLPAPWHTSESLKRKLLILNPRLCGPSGFCSGRWKMVKWL